MWVGGEKENKSITLYVLKILQFMMTNKYYTEHVRDKGYHMVNSNKKKINSVQNSTFYNNITLATTLSN